MYKILCNELLYSENNSNKYQVLFKGQKHDLSFYDKKTIDSLVSQKMIEVVIEEKQAKEKAIKE